MTTRGFSPVPVALGSASTETEENRAFFQDRLRLYTGWVFVLSFGFYLLSAANALAIPCNFLSECAISTPWSLARANVLWTEGYVAHVESGSPTPADSLLTLAVDIGDRISSVGSP